MKKRIAILAGDGVGPEVMTEALRVLDCLAKKYHHEFIYHHCLIGGAAYDQHQSHCPISTLEVCQSSDAILFGAVGGRVNEQHLEKWRSCETNSILKLRQHFNFSINIRPINICSTLAGFSPLKEKLLANDIDILIFRELNGGIYFGEHKQEQKNSQRVAYDGCHYAEQQIKVIVDRAFQVAQRRRKKLCSVDKANVLATSKLWREIVSEVSLCYPDVELSHKLIDNFVMQMVLDPGQFDVVLTENLFGDIISDLGAGLMGTLGLAPSASLNEQNFGLYEPAGGSAPDIAGKGIANPCAQILSAAMMLRYSFNMHEEADLIEKSVAKMLGSGRLTQDLIGLKSHTASIKECTDQIIEHMVKAR